MSLHLSKMDKEQSGQGGAYLELILQVQRLLVFLKEAIALVRRVAVSAAHRTRAEFAHALRSRARSVELAVAPKEKKRRKLWSHLQRTCQQKWYWHLAHVMC